MNAIKTLTACALPVMVATGCFASKPSPAEAPVPAAVRPTMIWAGPASALEFGKPSLPVERLQAAGVSRVKDNYFDRYPMHLKAHVSVFRDGQAIEVPGNLGIVPDWGTAAIHTHDANGVVYVVDDRVHDLTLGQFFTIWGVDLGQASAVYSNALRVDNPASLAFADRQAVAVVFGTPPAEIPSRYPGTR